MPEERKRDIVANRLRADILSGKYGPEGGLPEVKEICESTGYARGTVNAALTLLEGQGLIVERGRTFYVNRLVTRMTSYLPAPHERYSQRENYVKNIVPARRVSGLPQSLADFAGVPASTGAVWTVRVSGDIVNNREIPTQVISRYYLFALTDEQIKRMVEDASYEPAWLEPFPQDLHAHDTVSARLTTQEEAKTLALPYPTPVLNLREVMSDIPGNVLLAQEIVLTPRTDLDYHYQYDNRPVS